MRDAGVDVVAEIEIDQAERLREWVGGAREQPILVVAAGGDGTVGTAADAVAGTQAVLGVLPVGTANDFARSLGVPMHPVQAARLLAEGKVSTVDAGLSVVLGARPRHFVHAATAGLNVSFAKVANSASLRRRLGRLAYAVAAASAVRSRERFGAELHYDGEVRRLDLVHLGVMNAPVVGGPLGLRVGARLADRVLDVIAVEPMSPLRLLLAAVAPVLGSRRRPRGVHALRVRRLRVESRARLDVALDGEIHGRLPGDFEIAARAVRVVTPVDFDDGRD